MLIELDLSVEEVATLLHKAIMADMARQPQEVLTGFMDAQPKRSGRSRLR